MSPGRCELRGTAAGAGGHQAIDVKAGRAGAGAAEAAERLVVRRSPRAESGPAP
ncbi:hypothetical protein NX794_04245 [Streptomyces sp. LP11]|uniref:Uncharacterized protein n=1 Tax=Streptomyces pyxinicus TaxID=2970331 RepID=A0ABT2AW14_9ACTN|nr:hypothetical protein [Streptomyces sp. LP11]MCS0600445.1 hypothetical protein [Streptomyces sp. LP11]